MLISIILISIVATKIFFKNEVSVSQVSHFVCQKMGDNWYKLPSGSQHPSIFDQYVVAFKPWAGDRWPGTFVQKVPSKSIESTLRKPVTNYQFDKFEFWRPGIMMQKYFPELYEGRKVNINEMTIKMNENGYAPHLYCDEIRGKNVGVHPFTKDFERVGDNCLRSINPIFLGQKVMFSNFNVKVNSAGFSPRSMFSLANKEVETVGPNISVHFGSLDMIEEQNINDVLLEIIDYYEAWVSKIYIGPELTDGNSCTNTIGNIAQ